VKDKYIKRLTRIEKNQETILDELKQIKERLDQNINPIKVPTIQPYALPRTWKCEKCGIDMTTNNAYLCMRNDCPSKIVFI
jgi:rubrerythrin